MTKTIKKWLVAVLMFVLAVTVGLTASTFKSALAEANTTSAGNFVKYMANFDDKLEEGEDGAKTLDAAKFFGNDVNGGTNYYVLAEGETLPEGAIQITHKNLWRYYNLAKDIYLAGEYASLSDEDIAAVEVEGFAKAIANYNAVDKVVTNYYAAASNISFNMTKVVAAGDNFLYGGVSSNDSTAYPGAKEIKKLYNDVEAYKDIEGYGNGVYGYVKFTAGDYNFGSLKGAYNKVIEREGQILAFVNAVKAIDYLDADKNYQEAATDYSAAEGQTIVIKSKLTIEAAEAALKLIENDVDYLNTGDNGKLHIVYTIPAKEEGGEATNIDENIDFKAVYTAYETAIAAYDELRKGVTEFEGKIAALYTAVTGTEVNKYTLLIAGETGYKALQDEYDLLPTDTYNNQKDLVDTEKPEGGEKTYAEMLTELGTTLDGLNAKIAAVADLIKAANEYATKKYTGYYATASYTEEEGTVKATDYRGAIQAAEAAFKALEKDIQDHDTKEYAKAEGDKTYYVTKAYGEDDDAVTITYADLMVEFNKYKAWDDAVKAIIDNVTPLAEELTTPHQGEGYGLPKIVDLKNAVEEGYVDLNDEQEAFVNAQKVTVKNKDGVDVEKTVAQWKGEAITLIGEISASAGSLITAIENYTYSFALQKDLINLLQRFYSLTPKNRDFVNNSSKLLGYVEDYKADLEKVKDWQDAVAAIEEGKVTVENMAKVKAAIDAYELLSKDNAGISEYYTKYKKVAVADGTDVTNRNLYDEPRKEEGEEPLTADQINALLNAQYNSYMASYKDKTKTTTTTTPAEEEGGEETTVTTVTVEKYGYESYAAAYVALNAKIDNVVELVEALGNKESFSNLAVAETSAWAPKVTAITAALDELKDDSTLDEDALYSYAGAKDHIWTLADEDTYLTALKYVKSYAVEGKIADIWAGYVDENGELISIDFYNYEENKKVDLTAEKYEPVFAYISLAVKDAITAARTELTDYDGDVVIRNDIFLVKAEETLAAIEKELNDWAKTVDTLKMTKEGYGLKLDDWKVVFDNYATLVGGTWVDPTEDTEEADKVTVWVKNGEAYEKKVYTLSEGVDADKVAYEAVATAYAKLLSIYELSNTAVKNIDADMAEIIDHAANQEGGLSTTDYENVKKINDNLDRMSDSQKALLENLEDYNDMDLSAVNAANAFNDLYMALYKKVVTDKEVTSFTGIYAEMVDAIYQQFDQNVKALINSDYAEKMEEIKGAYDAAVEAGTVGSNGDITALEEEIAGIKEDITTLTESIEALEGDIEDINTAIAGHKESIEQLQKDLADAIAANASNSDAIANEISARIAAISELEGKLDKANEAIAANKKAIEDEVKAREAAIAAARKASDDADEAMKAIYDKAIEDINASITALEDGVTALDGAMTTAQDDIKTLKIQLADAFGRIDTLQSNIASLETKITSLETALDEYKALESKARDEGDKALEAKIAEEIAKVNTAIADAKKALEGDIKTVSDGLAAADKAIVKANADIKDLTDKLNAISSKVTALETANEDLTKQVKDLQGKISGIVAGVIIVGLALGIAVAVFAVITLLRKKNG